MMPVTGILRCLMVSCIMCLTHHCACMMMRGCQGVPSRLEHTYKFLNCKLQMLGENVVGTVLEMGRQIRQQASEQLPAGDAEGSVFLDILGGKMVCTNLLMGLGIIEALHLGGRPGCMWLLLRAFNMHSSSNCVALAHSHGGEDFSIMPLLGTFAMMYQHGKFLWNLQILG